MNMSLPAVGSNRPDIVRINVGGNQFLTTTRTIKAVPDTRLSNLTTSAAEYDPELKTYFFDRNPELFNAILDFYRTGELHLPKYVCGAAIRNELEFWQIASTSIADCCVASLFHYEDELEVTKNLKDQFESQGLEYTKEELVDNKWNHVKNKIWNLLDKPSSSKQAKVFSVLYFIFVLLTCLLFILSSHSSCRMYIDEYVTVNSTHTLSLYDYMVEKHGNPKLAEWGATDTVPSVTYINIICMIFFSFELLLRYISCPRKELFFRNLLNVVDLFIVIFMVFALIVHSTGQYKYNTGLLWAYLVARACIIFRLFRLFRLAKHYSGLKILYLALRASFQELGLLFLTFMITSSLIGGLMYYAEFLTADTFDSVPIAIWWAIVTLTTVGYGDYYPVTPLGYVIGAVCGMCGLLLLSMPIAIIATNFNDYYTRNKVREKQLKRRDDILKRLRNLFNSRSAVSVFQLEGNMNNDNANTAQTSNHVENGDPLTSRNVRLAFAKMKSTVHAK